MKISCEKAILLEALIKASWAVSSKSSAPVLECLLLEAEDNLTITGYNLETGIQAVINADISTKGSIVVKAKLLCDIVRQLPDEIVTISVADNMMLSIKCRHADFDIIGMSPEEFPKIPVIESEKSLSIPQNTLKSMISETIFAISTNEAKPVHTGSLFEVSENNLNMVSIDGFRLALRTETVKNNSESREFSFIVPGHTLKEVERLCGDSEDEVNIMLGKKHIMFSLDGTVIISRILEGEFLNYRNAIPKAAAFTTKVAKRDLAESIDRVSVIIGERIKNPIKLSFNENSIELSCVTSVGKSQDICPLLSPADSLEIGFNDKYLSDALKACPDEEIILELNNHISPLVIRPAEGEKYLYLILPVRLKTETLT
jgi:DNA polymerase-3 subunit beta